MSLFNHNRPKIGRNRAGKRRGLGEAARRLSSHRLRLGREQLEQRIALAVTHYAFPAANVTGPGGGQQSGWVTVMSNDGDDIFLQQVATSPNDLIYANNSSFNPTPGSAGVVPAIEQYRTIYVTNGTPETATAVSNVNYPMSSAAQAATATTDFVLFHEEVRNLTDRINLSPAESRNYAAVIQYGGSNFYFNSNGQPVTNPTITSPLGVVTTSSEFGLASNFTELVRPAQVRIINANRNYTNDSGKSGLQADWSAPPVAGAPPVLAFARYQQGEITVLGGDTIQQTLGSIASSGQSPTFRLPISGPRMGIVRGTLTGTILAAGQPIPFSCLSLTSNVLRFDTATFGQFTDGGDPRIVTGTVRWETGELELQFFAGSTAGVGGGGFATFGPQDVGPVTVSAEYGSYVQGSPLDPMDATFFDGLDITREVVVDLTSPDATIHVDSPIRNAASAASATAVLGVGDAAGQVVAIAVNAVGSGYTTVPTVTIAPPPPSTDPLKPSSPASATAIIDGTGAVIGFTIVTPGAGYTTPPQITISLPTSAPLPGADIAFNATNILFDANAQAADRIDIGLDGLDRFFAQQAPTTRSRFVNAREAGEENLQAFATAQVAGGQVTGFILHNGHDGSGYSAATPPVVTISGGGGSGATATAIVDAQGRITRLNLTSQGSGYTSVPTVTISPPPTFAQRAAQIAIPVNADGTLPSIQIPVTATGARYQFAPEVIIQPPPDGADADRAYGIAVMNGDAVVGIQLTNVGSGYDPNRPPLAFIARAQAPAIAEVIRVNSGVGADVYDIRIGDDRGTPRERGELLVSSTGSLSRTVSPTAEAASVPATTLYVQADLSDLLIEGTVNAVDQTYLMRSESPRNYLSPFEFTTRSRETTAMTGLVRGATVAVTLGNDAPTPLSGTDVIAFNDVDLDTEIDSMRVRAASLRARRGAATASIAGGGVAGVAVTDMGTGYAVPPTVSFIGGGGSGAAAVALLSPSGSIARIDVTNAGTGYTTPPTVVITAPVRPATATATIASGAVTAVTPAARGAGYGTAPVVTLTGGGGTGATAQAVVVNGRIEDFIVTNPGVGYTSAPQVTIAPPKSAAYPYRLSVNELDAVRFDAVAASSLPIDIASSGNVTFTSSVLTAGDLGIRIEPVVGTSSTFRVSAPLATTGGRINVEADDIVVSNSLRVLGTNDDLRDIDPVRDDITLLARNGSIALTGLVSGRNNVVMRQQTTAGTGSIAGPSRVQARDLRVFADRVGNPSLRQTAAGYYLRTDVDSLSGEVRNGFAVDERNDIAIPSLRVPEGLVSLKAGGVDGRRIGGLDSTNAIALSANLVDVRNLFVTTPAGSTDVRVQTSQLLTIGVPVAVRDQTTESMQSAGNVRIRSVNGQIDIFDAPLAGSGARTVRVATSVQIPAATYAAGTPGSLASTIRGAVGSSLNSLVGSVAGSVFVTGTPLRVNDRVLVKDGVGVGFRSDQRANGVYVVTSIGGTGTAGWRLTRAADSDTAADMPANSVVAATEARQWFKLDYTGTLGLVPVTVSAFNPTTDIGVDTPDNSRTARFIVGSTNGTNSGAGSLGKMISLRQANDTRLSTNPGQAMDFAFSSLINAPIQLVESLPAITGNPFVPGQSSFVVDGARRVAPAGGTPGANVPVSINGRNIVRNDKQVPVFRGTVSATVLGSERLQLRIPSSYADFRELNVGMSVSGLAIRPGTRITALDPIGRVVTLSDTVNSPQNSIVSVTFALAHSGIRFSGANAAGSALRNLRIGGFEADAAVRVESPNVTVENLIIGQDASGNRIANETGITVGSGATNVMVRNNLINSSTVAGIRTEGTATGTTIVGNTIGSQFLQNVVGVELAASGTTFLGLAGSPRNVVQFNQRGVVLRNGDNRLMNNTITRSVFEGVRIEGGFYTIGDSTNLSGSSNIIHANSGWGILMLAGWAPANPQADGRRIQGNYLGVVADGTLSDVNRLGNVATIDAAGQSVEVPGLIPNPVSNLDDHGNLHGLRVVGGPTPPQPTPPGGAPPNRPAPVPVPGARATTTPSS